MFIIKFNNMIRNKWLWGAFAIIVAGAFILSDSMLSSNSFDNGAETLNGEAVNIQEVNAIFNIAKINRERMNNPLADADYSLEDETWLMLAALKKAEELNISVSDDEVVDAIKNDRTFKDDNGDFDKSRANIIVQQYLNMSMPQYEEFLRTNIKISKLRTYVLSLVSMVPEAEIKLGVDSMTDIFTFTPAVFSNTVVASELEISDDELKAYFEVNKEAYRKPVRVSVRQVAFEASKFVDKSKVTEEDIQNYYDENYETFLVKGENGAEDTYKPLEDVKEQIITAVARKASETAAYDAADLFNNKLLSDSSLSMEALAAEYGYTVVTTALFSADAPAPVVMKNSEEYVDAAFNLLDEDDENAHLNYSDEPIYAGTQSFVIAYNSHEPSIIPEFEEVRALVLRDKQIMKSFELFNKKISDMSAAITNENATFESIVKDFNLTPGTNITTSVRNIFISGSEKEKQMLGFVSKLEKGTMEIESLSDGSCVLLNVLDRIPASDEEKKEIEPFVRYNLQREIASRVWVNWLETNLKEMNPEKFLNLDKNKVAE